MNTPAPALTLLLVLIFSIALSVVNGVIIKNTRPYLYLFFARFGVPLHEFCHYIIALICGHKVHSVKFYDPNGVTLGYVRHESRFKLLSPVSNLLISFAPLYIGIPLALYAMSILTPSLFQQLLSVNSIVDYTNINYLDKTINMVCGFSVVSIILIYCMPSKTDVYNSLKGWLVLLLVTYSWYMTFPESLSTSLEIVGNNIVIYIPHLLFLLAFQFVFSIILMIKSILYK